jgi:hypothetical protein
VTNTPTNYSIENGVIVVIHNPKYFRGTAFMGTNVDNFLEDSGIAFYEFTYSGVICLSLSPNYTGEKTCFLSKAYAPSCNYIDIIANNNYKYVVSDESGSNLTMSQFLGRNRCLLFASVNEMSYKISSYGSSYYYYNSSTSQSTAYSGKEYSLHSTTLLLLTTFSYSNNNITINPIGLYQENEDPNIDYYRGVIMTKRTSYIIPFEEAGEHVKNIPAQGVELDVPGKSCIIFNNPDYFVATGRSFYKPIEVLGETGLYHYYYSEFGKLLIKPRLAEYNNLPCYYTVFNIPSDVSISSLSIYSGLNAIFYTTTSGRFNLSKTCSPYILFSSPVERKIVFNVTELNQYYQSIQIYCPNGTKTDKLTYNYGVYTMYAKSFMIYYYSASRDSTAFIRSDPVEPPTKDIKFIEDLVHNLHEMIYPYSYINGGDFVHEIDPKGFTISLYSTSYLIIHNPKYFTAVYNNEKYFGEDGLKYFSSTINTKIRVFSNTGKAEQCYFSVIVNNGIKCDAVEVHDGPNLNFNASTNSLISNISLKYYSSYCILATSMETIKYTYQKQSTSGINVNFYVTNGSIISDDTKFLSDSFEGKSFMIHIKISYSYSGTVSFNSSIIEEFEYPQYVFSKGITTGNMIFHSDRYIRSGDYVVEIDSIGKNYSIFSYSLVVIHNPSYFIISTNASSYDVHE